MSEPNEPASSRGNQSRDLEEEIARLKLEYEQQLEKERNRADKLKRRAEKAEKELERKRADETQRRIEEKVKWKVNDNSKTFTPSTLANIGGSNGVQNTYKRCKESGIVIGYSRKIRESATLLYPDFSNFANNFRNQEVDSIAIECARTFVPILRQHFPNERERRDCFFELLEKMIPDLQFHKEFKLSNKDMGGKLRTIKKDSTGKNKEKAGKHVQAGIYIIGTSKECHQNEVPVLITEIKNEEGCTTSEPLVEAMGFYKCFAVAATFANGSIPRLWPSLIILHIGKSIRVYGAVTFTRVNPESQERELRYLCEHLYSLSLNDHDEKAIQEMCNFLAALRDQVTSILQFRSNTGTHPGCAGIPYPIRDDKNFLKTSGSVKLIPNTHVYVNGSFVWKFTRQYSEDAHNCAADLKIAPKLIYCKTIGEWKLVCMQKVKGEMVNSQFLNDNLALWTEFNENVKSFHKKGFVHGDLRQQNIMFGSLPEEQEANRFFILDFDWAGKKDQVCYPISINMDTIRWPEGVSPLQLISSVHDEYWLSTLKK